MDLNQKTDKWVGQKIITPKQKEAILALESQNREPFVFRTVLWLGIFCIGLGVISIIAANWIFIPPVVKLIAMGVLLVGALGAAFWGFQKEKNLLAEVALFFAFLMIGGGIGLIGQVFHLTPSTFKGLLLWAILSFGIVFFSKRQLLGLLWVPLFIGGVLGSFRWELLLLFFQQTPVLAMIIGAGICLGIAFLTRNLTTPFLKSIYHWALILFFVMLGLGELGTGSVGVRFLAFVGMMILMGVFAVFYDKRRLFNWVAFFITLRCLLLYFQVFKSLSVTGVGFILSGLVILGIGVLWPQFKKRAFRKMVLKK